MKARKPNTAQLEFRARRFSSGAIRPFDTDTAVLEAMELVVRLRAATDDEKTLAAHRRLAGLEARSTRRLNQRLAASPASLRLVALFREHRLSRIEREIVLALILSGVGMVDTISDVEDLQKLTRRRGRERLAVVRALADESRLVSSGLVEVGEGDAPIDRSITLSSQALAPLLSRDGKGASAWRVKRPEELLDRCYPLCRALADRSRSIDEQRRYHWSCDDPKETTRKIDRLTRDLVRTLELHSDWALHQLLVPVFSTAELAIVITLLAKERGYFESNDDLFTGEGLAKAASRSVPEIREQIARLGRERKLRREGFVRVVGAVGDGIAVEDDAELRKLHFELADGYLEKLGVSRQRRSLGRARAPLVKPEQLVFSERVLAALDMAIAQARHARVLIEEWGLGEVIPYGRAVVALFSGPPGVGKTAAAEAMAAKLGRPIMVVCYAEVQSCYIGETEKNVVRTFREATEADAVLFWDEADAMFYDRDSAQRSWEVRDVNVLLQELERFQGLCILATNRKVTLDKALERRVSIKVEFERPDRESRKHIWQKLLPAKLPIASDVDVERLADEELSGGEIKNIVLNAARLALARDARGPLLAADFERALQMEREGRWGRRAGSIGFGGKRRAPVSNLIA